MRSMHVLLGGWLVLGSCGGASQAEPAHPPAPPDAVRPGLEVLLSDSLHLVRGRRIGLVTNQAGVDRRGTSAVDLLRRAPVRLVALFSPEHGFRGTAAPGKPVASSIDSATGLPIYSLYGRNSAPTDSMLRGIEVMLVDLQDAGARYYTFLWTAVGILRSAQRNHIPVILLDRPNPIGGLVQGNVLDTAYRSAVGYAAIPMRHGMTLGELALLAQHDFGLTARLTVVPAAGWRRSMYFDATALPWIPPSPNLRTIESLIHYPGLCLFEGSTLSVGRGSDHPFEQVGAPWLDSAAVLAWLRRHPVPGVEFSSVVFTPTAPGDGKFADTTVTGIRLRVTDRAVYDPVLAAVAMFAALQDSPTLAGSSAPVFPVDTRHLLRLYGAPLSQLALQLRLLEEDSALMQVDRVTQWREQRADFLRRRRPFLLYPE